MDIESKEKRPGMAGLRGHILVNPDFGLTKSAPATSFRLFRGHLSRPACSHVKKLAKQAGDASDPGRTYRSGRVFHGLIPAAA
jgi:hypothetical protein